MFLAEIPAPQNSAEDAAFNNEKKLMTEIYKSGKPAKKIWTAEMSY